MRVYKFLSATIASKVIAERRLKISTFPEMNDPFELAGIKFIAENIRSVGPEHHAHFMGIFRNSIVPTILRQVGAVCFSKAWHNPVLWAYYGDLHRGIVLGFNVEESETLEIRPAKYVDGKATYDTSELLDEGVRSSFENRPMEMEPYIPIFQELLGTKFKDWAYEEEVRVFASLQEEVNAMFFVNFD